MAASSNLESLLSMAHQDTLHPSTSKSTAPAKVLLVDDDNAIRFSLGKILEHHGFNVSIASNVSDALRLISSESFDVLLSDLHMPGPGDGLTVVSAMRHANPKAVTLLLSAFPQMTAAANAILLQTDEILVKPMNVPALMAVIEERLRLGAPPPRVVESVATILERTAQNSIDLWYAGVQLEPKLMAFELRCGHLPQVFRDLVVRLKSFKSLGSKDLASEAAIEHGAARFRQGYSAAMMVEESRILQVSIFETLQNNLMNIDFSVLLIGVMTIADEVDSQLSQAMESYAQISVQDALPA
jgi:ActR/RegA family two-component response regulator